MGQFVGFHVAGDPGHPGKTTPISTGATHDEALATAVQRMLTLPGSGYVDVQEREDLAIDDFAKLTITLDAHFAKHLFGKSQ